MKINLLTADVYNRISAGEVVDRPYSVVKELVENAIDAGASEITVEIECGGKKRIRVVDNGCGIEKEDLERAYHPHATSKLQAASDLFAIETLGFRGEAIPSIASVSRMKILSRTQEGGAYELICEGGVLGKVCEAGGALGTEVTVDDLFYNTPARLKFMKSDSAEEGDVGNMMARFILSRPQIAFTYLTNGKVRYRSFGDGLTSAIAAVYGAETLQNCYEISANKHGICLYGFIGNQHYAKANRSYQSLFVNGRYVVNQTVASAIMNAYQSYLMKRQYPFYVLFLDIPPEIVDVNVHPNKADVRFADNQIIYGSVYSVVSSVLDGNSRALEYLAGKDVAPVVERMPETVSVVPETSKKEVENTSQPLQMTFAQAKKELAFDVSPVGGKTPAPKFTFDDKPVLEVRSKETSVKEDFFEENRRFLREQEKAVQEKIDTKSLVYKGELFRTYLFYEEGDCAYLVDQHAAHERLIYDKLREKCEKREIITQPMLVPYLLNVNAQEFAFLQKNFAILRELGFDIEEFGDTSIKVSALPVDLYGMNLPAFFDEVLSSMESLRGVRLVDIVKDKLASAACKAAVKGGEMLTEGEVRSLIERMDGNMGLKCPHGRPVAVKIKKSEMEKLFKRIV